MLDAAAFRQDSALRSAALELRQVSDSADDAPLALQVPLLRRRGRDAREQPMARPAPRVTAAKLAQQLEAALSALAHAELAESDAAAPAAPAAPWEAVTGVAWDAGAAQRRA